MLILGFLGSDVWLVLTLEKGRIGGEQICGSRVN